jgi:hypothetical protein
MIESSGEDVLTSGANFFRRSGLHNGFNDGGCFGGGGSFLKMSCSDSGECLTTCGDEVEEDSELKFRV